MAQAGHTQRSEDDRHPESAGKAEVSSRTLVESMVREDGTIDAGELYEVAGHLGMTDQQVRLTIKRLTSGGWLTQEGRGRRALLRTTDDARRSLEPEVGFIRHMYAQDRGEAPWDGVWHLVAFAVPESAKPARDALRNTLVHLGGAPIQGGLYVAANAWEDLVEDEAGRLEISDCVTFLTSADLRIGDQAEPAGLAARLWPLERLAAGHRRLAALARDRLRCLQETDAPTRTEYLTIAIELAAEFTRAIEHDPLLPPELLPQPWPGVQARALLAGCWAQLRQHPPQDPTPRLFRLYADAIHEVISRIPTSA